MLTPSQFQLWCLRFHLPPAACEMLARVPSSPPVRRVHSRANNVSGVYFLANVHAHERVLV